MSDSFYKYKKEVPDLRRKFGNGPDDYHTRYNRNHFTEQNIRPDMDRYFNRDPKNQLSNDFERQAYTLDLLPNPTEPIHPTLNEVKEKIDVHEHMQDLFNNIPYLYDTELKPFFGKEDPLDFKKTGGLQYDAYSPEYTLLSTRLKLLKSDILQLKDKIRTLRMQSDKFGDNLENIKECERGIKEQKIQRGIIKKLMQDILDAYIKRDTAKEKEAVAIDNYYRHGGYDSNQDLREALRKTATYLNTEGTEATVRIQRQSKKCIL